MWIADCGMSYMRNLASGLVTLNAQLLLLQVFFYSFGLAKQKRGILLGGVDGSGDSSQMLLELVGKFFMLAVAPCGVERMKLASERGNALFQFFIEVLQLMRKSAQLARLDNCLRHDVVSSRFPVHCPYTPSPTRGTLARHNTKRSPHGVCFVDSGQFLVHRGHGRADLIFRVGTGDEKSQPGRTFLYGRVENGLHVHAP